jgi:hypothetical protein
MKVPRGTEATTPIEDDDHDTLSTGEPVSAILSRASLRQVTRDGDAFVGLNNDTSADNVLRITPPKQANNISRAGTRVEDQEIDTVLNQHWAASASGDQDAEHDIYADDVVCDYPQSGERILGRYNLQTLRSHHPDRPAGFEIHRLFGAGNLWITEYTIDYQGRPSYTVSIMEFRNGKVAHETQYFADPFEAPAWRAEWVQHSGP